jgi:hypothetical protein
MFDALLKFASEPSLLADPSSLSWGTEVDRLAPSTEDAAAVPKESGPEVKECASAATTTTIRTFAHPVGAGGIPSIDGVVKPLEVRTALLRLSTRRRQTKSRGLEEEGRRRDVCGACKRNRRELLASRRERQRQAQH